MARRNSRGSGSPPPTPRGGRAADGSRQSWRRILARWSDLLCRGSCNSQCAVHVGPPVAEELPGLPYFGDQVQIQIGGQDFIAIARRLGDNLAPRIAEVARAVEFADIPGSFHAHAVDGGDVITIRHRMRGLFQLPEVLAQSRDGGGRIEDDLRPIEPQRARALGEVAVVTDVDADARHAHVEHRIAQVARPEIELLPKAGRHVRNMRLAIFAEIAAFGRNHRGGVVVHALQLAFVYRDNQGDVVLAGDVLHEAHRGAVRHGLGEIVPSHLLLGAEIRTVEQLLEAHDSRAGVGGLPDIAQMLVDHGPLDLWQRQIRRGIRVRLDERTADETWHACAPVDRIIIPLRGSRAGCLMFQGEPLGGQSQRAKWYWSYAVIHTPICACAIPLFYWVRSVISEFLLRSCTFLCSIRVTIWRLLAGASMRGSSLSGTPVDWRAKSQHSAIVSNRPPWNTSMNTAKSASRYCTRK